MYSGTGFDSNLKLIFKSFPITMWIIQKLYENGNGNQFTLGNININAWNDSSLLQLETKCLINLYHLLRNLVKYNLMYMSM